jgi:hypothetical protein
MVGRYQNECVYLRGCFERLCSVYYRHYTLRGTIAIRRKISRLKILGFRFGCLTFFANMAAMPPPQKPRELQASKEQEVVNMGSLLIFRSETGSLTHEDGSLRSFEQIALDLRNFRGHNSFAYRMSYSI